jgi:hypothetical protein
VPSRPDDRPHGYCFKDDFVIARLLNLSPAELGRATPLLGLYALLFAALTLIDGLSLVLFVHKLGTQALPLAMAVASVAVWLSVNCYTRLAVHRSSGPMFVKLLLALIAPLAMLWAGLAINIVPPAAMILLLVLREVAYTLVLLHFGNYLLDFFSRTELTRVMPIVYSGGRLGGLLAGLALVWIPSLLSIHHLAILSAALLVVALVGIVRLERRPREVETTEPTANAADEGASESIVTLLRRYPLLVSLTITTLVFFGCRSLLAFQYTAGFERAFQSERELTVFLGYYAQISLGLALIIQLVVVSRMIGLLGVKGSQLVYAALVLLAAASGLWTDGLMLAVLARFVESELRFSLRNPISQMIVNEFPKTVRIRARSWTLGTLIPLGGGLAALVMGTLVATGATSWIPWLGLAMALAYGAASLQLIRHFEEPAVPKIQSWLSRFRSPRSTELSASIPS